MDWGRVTLVKGFYSDTLNNELVAKQDIRKASILMIDCDMYSSAIESLNFCEPFILDEAIIIFDDWNPLAKKNNPDLTAVETGTYSYNPDDLNGKIFRISRTPA